MTSSGLLGSHSGGGRGSSPATTSGGGHAGGGNEPYAATATSGPEVWKRYDLRGIQLGMSRKHLLDLGFSCGERANQRCFKVMDARCKTAVCKFKEDKTFGDQWFELNGNKTALDYMTCATTESAAALVYQCRLQINPRQILAPDSTLGKALIAKYGMYVEKTDPESSDPEGGGRLLWWNPELGNNGPKVDADCTSEIDGMTGKPLEHQCKIDIEDDGLLKMEREKQEELDANKKRAAQPTKGARAVAGQRWTSRPSASSSSSTNAASACHSSTRRR